MQAISTVEKEYVPCNLCEADQYTVVTETSRCIQTANKPFTFHVRLVCCSRCGLVYWNPRMTATELRRYYAGVYRAPVLPDSIDDGRRSTIQSRMRLLRQHIPRGRVLEIGSGEGFFLQKAIDEGFEAIGIEPSNSYAEVSRCLVSQAKVHRTYFEYYESKERSNAICSFFVLEHMLDATEFLNKCYRLLAEDGWLYLEIPDVELYPSQLNDMIWHEHAYHFTRAAIRKLLAKTGFMVTDIHSPGPSYQFGMAIFAQKKDRAWIDQAAWCLPDPAAHQLAVQCFKAHFEQLERYRAALRQEVDRLLKRVHAERRKLAVYGTGVFYDLLYAHTNLKAGDVTIVIDDNKEKWGKPTNQGVKIESPKRLSESEADIVLIASDCFEAKMSENVARWSCEHGKHYEPFRPHARAVEIVLLSSEREDEDGLKG